MRSESDRDALLLVLPVPLRRADGGSLLFEKQACNGLDQWANNFPRLVVACPLIPDAVVRRVSASLEYLGVDQLAARDRIEFVPLPWAYTPVSFLRHHRSTRALLRGLIDRCDYLCFAIGGLFGDWASVAALEAARRGRPYAVWTDRVEHRVLRTAHADHTGVRRLYHRVRNCIYAPLMKRLERRVIRRCALGLFHGGDCYDAYARDCRSAHLVHDIHLKPADVISAQDLREKVGRMTATEPLRLLYAGRAAGEKGPLDWVRVMSGLRERGIEFTATWLGDGPQLDGARAECVRLGLEKRVSFPGFVGDRALVLRSLRDADLFVFCHKTPESPRCLIEALASGTPIVGYDSPYPRDLAGPLADRLLVPRNDTGALVTRLTGLHEDRTALAELTTAVAALGSSYSDEAVFRHRSELIREYLGGMTAYGALSGLNERCRSGGR